MLSSGDPIWVREWFHGADMPVLQWQRAIVFAVEKLFMTYQIHDEDIYRRISLDSKKWRRCGVL